MAKIAVEEADHAALAWATIRWAIETGGESVKRAVDEAFAAARVRPPVHGRIECAAHGLLPDRSIAAAMHRAFTAVVRPCAARLVA